ncbi:MAG TPA: hypothetical protein VMR70_16515 [Flavisolibacter sp.]|nr:hypothetical protein [Flavisolibacter sp.]
MRLPSVFKALAILAYFIIVLKGTLISLPLFVYLLFTLVDFGTTQQVFSAVAFLGLLIYFSHPVVISTRKKFLIDCFVFLCLSAPIAYRLLSSHPGLYNYPLFVIPVVCFGLLFLTALIILGQRALRQPAVSPEVAKEPESEE